MSEGKKKFNKSLLLILILALGVFITACGNKDGETTPSEQETEITETTETTDMETDGMDEETEVEDETENEAAEVKELHGVVADATMNTITVQDDEGNNYSFATADIDAQTGESGIVIGNPITIEYKGKLNSKSMEQNVKIQSITVEDKDQNDVQ